jgi:hypothetical protein
MSPQPGSFENGVEMIAYKPRLSFSTSPPLSFCPSPLLFFITVPTGNTKTEWEIVDVLVSQRI